MSKLFSGLADKVNDYGQSIRSKADFVGSYVRDQLDKADDSKGIKAIALALNPGLFATKLAVEKAGEKVLGEDKMTEIADKVKDNVSNVAKGITGATLVVGDAITGRPAVEAIAKGAKDGAENVKNLIDEHPEFKDKAVQIAKELPAFMISPALSPTVREAVEKSLTDAKDKVEKDGIGGFFKSIADKVAEGAKNGIDNAKEALDKVKEDPTANAVFQGVAIGTGVGLGGFLKDAADHVVASIPKDAADAQQKTDSAILEAAGTGAEIGSAAVEAAGVETPAG